MRKRTESNRVSAHTGDDPKRRRARLAQGVPHSTGGVNRSQTRSTQKTRPAVALGGWFAFFFNHGLKKRKNVMQCKLSFASKKIKKS